MGAVPIVLSDDDVVVEGSCHVSPLKATDNAANNDDVMVVGLLLA